MEEELGELGNGGQRPRTDTGYTQSIKQFNDFVEHCKKLNQGIGAKKFFKYFADWKAEEMADEQVYRQFAFYLGNNAVKVITKLKKGNESINFFSISLRRSSRIFLIQGMESPFFKFLN